MVGMTLLKLQVYGKWPKVSTQWVLFFSILISVREVGGSGNTDLHLAEWQQSVGDELPAPLQGAMCLLQLFPLWFPYTTCPYSFTSSAYLFRHRSLQPLFCRGCPSHLSLPVQIPVIIQFISDVNPSFLQNTDVTSPSWNVMFLKLILQHALYPVTVLFLPVLYVSCYDL